MDKQKTAAGALFVSSKTGRALLSMRAAHKTYRCEWALFGGMIDGVETPKEALLRECDEEMGFVPDISKIYPFDVYESRDKNFRYYTFVCIVDDEFLPRLNDESIGYMWIELGTWPKPMHQGVRGTLCSNKAKVLLDIILGQHLSD